MTEFYIVRHGRTFANAAGLKQGIINTPQTYLTDEGRAQAQLLAQNFDLRDFDALYVSPLERTKQTAAILNEEAQLPVIEDGRLLEISSGDWDGQPNDELMNQYPELFSTFVKDVRPEYAAVAHGETFTHVEKRVQDFIKDVTAQHPDERVVVVTHGFTVRSFAASATHAPGLTILEPENCSVTKLIVEPTTLEQHLIYYNRSTQGF